MGVVVKIQTSSKY